MSPHPQPPPTALIIELFNLVSHPCFAILIILMGRFQFSTNNLDQESPAERLWFQQMFMAVLIRDLFPSSSAGLTSLLVLFVCLSIYYIKCAILTTITIFAAYHIATKHLYGHSTVLSCFNKQLNKVNLTKLRIISYWIKPTLRWYRIQYREIHI